MILIWNTYFLSSLYGILRIFLKICFDHSVHRQLAIPHPRYNMDIWYILVYFSIWCYSLLTTPHSSADWFARCVFYLLSLITNSRSNMFSNVIILYYKPVVFNLLDASQSWEIEGISMGRENVPKSLQKISCFQWRIVINDLWLEIFFRT